MILSLLLSLGIVAVNANDCRDVIRLWKAFGQTTALDPNDPTKCCDNTELNVFCNNKNETTLVVPVQIIGL